MAWDVAQWQRALVSVPTMGVRGGRKGAVMEEVQTAINEQFKSFRDFKILSVGQGVSQTSDDKYFIIIPHGLGM